MNYKSIKKYLEPGDLARTAIKFKMTRGAVSQIISGKTRNNKVLSHLLSLAEESKRIDEQILALSNS